MGLIMQEGKFVGREDIACIDTPNSTDTWRPVPHIDVIEAVTEVVRAHGWAIEGEKFGLAREGQKMFGVMEIARSSSPEWHRSLGIRNSHDKSFAAGLSAGIVVLVCSNLAFGGTTVIKRRHTSGIDLSELIDRAVASLEEGFLITETVCEDLKDAYLRDDDEARSCIVRAAELGVINSSDILPVYREYKVIPNTQDDLADWVGKGIIEYCKEHREFESEGIHFPRKPTIISMFGDWNKYIKAPEEKRKELKAFEPYPHFSYIRYDSQDEVVEWGREIFAPTYYREQKKKMEKKGKKKKIDALDRKYIGGNAGERIIDKIASKEDREGYL